MHHNSNISNIFHNKMHKFHCYINPLCMKSPSRHITYRRSIILLKLHEYLFQSLYDIIFFFKSASDITEPIFIVIYSNLCNYWCLIFLIFFSQTFLCFFYVCLLTIFKNHIEIKSKKNTEGIFLKMRIG